MKLIAAAVLVSLAGTAPARVHVGDFTYGLAAGGGSVWAGEMTTGDVVRVDPASGKIVGRVAAGARIFDVTSSPGAVWAVGNVSGTVAHIDTRTGKIAKIVHVGLEPYAVAWGFGSAWVSNSGDGTVSRITGDRVVKRIKVGVEPNGLTAYDGSVWVSDHTVGKVVRIDPRTNRITGSVKLSGADWIVGLGGSLYVSQETNTVARIDAKTLRVTGPVKVDTNPLGAAVVGGKIWVPCIDAGRIDVVDPASLRVVRRLAAGLGPIVVLPAFGHEWVSQTAGESLLRF